MTNLKLYCGTYGKYSEGSIFGKWIDLSDYSNLSDFYKDIRILHKDEEDPEFMFQDYEASGLIISLGLISECHISDNIFDILETIENSVYGEEVLVHTTHQGYNPEGQDGLGYDIEYFDDDGNKFFVEVKGKADNFESFEISKNELDKAHQEKEFYKIIFVTQTMNNSQRRIRDLGNLFSLDTGEDFLANRKFKAIYRNFEIRFQEQ